MRLLSLAAIEAARDEQGEVDWREFYDQHFELVWWCLVRFGAPSDELEDLAQEVFSIAHRKLSDFRGESSHRTWLFSIARKLASRTRRRVRFRRAALQVLGLARTDRSTPPPSGAARDVASLLEKLPEVQRVTLLLYEVDGLRIPEIAALFGCPEATVWSRIRLALATLRRLAGDAS